MLYKILNILISSWLWFSAIFGWICMGIVAHYYIAGKKTRKMIRDDMERDELYSKNRFISHCKIDRPHIWFKDRDQKRWIH